MGISNPHTPVAMQAHESTSGATRHLLLQEAYCIARESAAVTALSGTAYALPYELIRFAPYSILPQTPQKIQGVLEIGNLDYGQLIARCRRRVSIIAMGRQKEIRLMFDGPHHFLAHAADRSNLYITNVICQQQLSGRSASNHSI